MLCGRKRTEARSVCNRKLNGMDHVMAVRMSRSGGGRLCVAYSNGIIAGPPVAANPDKQEDTRADVPAVAAIPVTLCLCDRRRPCTPVKWC
jgi:hypothetical protein